MNVRRDQLQPEKITAQGRFDLSAEILPHLGANLVSLQVEGREYIFWDDTELPDDEHFLGGFTMFPTPCRLAGSTYEFEGRRIEQRKHGEPVSTHGLVRDEPMAFEHFGDRLVCSLEIKPGHPVYEGFPYHCRLQVEHALQERGLKVSFEVENLDTRPLPCGYGIHPFWRIQGTRREVSVRIPCERTLELAELIPTGRSFSLAGTELDLREWRNIESLFIDNIFWPRRPGDTAGIRFEAAGMRLQISAADCFPHMIVYAPEGEDFLCVENLTTSPNAPNLCAAGFAEVANMLVVAPGAKAGGWISYEFFPLTD